MSIEIRQKAERHPSRKNYWNWQVWIDGPKSELDRVDRVTYFLHPTFKHKIRTIRSRQSKFRLKASGWGEFMIRAHLHTVSGDVQELEHWLRLQDDLFGSDRPAEVKRSLAAGTARSVFLSAASSDAQLADQMREALEATGAQVKTAEDASPDLPWTQAVQDEIERSDLFIAITPPTASAWLDTEVQIARANNVEVVPLVLAERGHAETPAFRDITQVQIKDASDLDALARDIVARVARDGSRRSTAAQRIPRADRPTDDAARTAALGRAAMTHLKVWNEKYDRADRGKRLLACQGGGILGIISLEILLEMERQLAEMTGEGEKFRLGRFFDYIAGTSTGAIIATGLAIGKTVQELIDFYQESGPAMFEKEWLLKRARALFTADPLIAKLKEILGERTLGDPDLECLLLVVTRNASTDSPWLLSNNPFAKYNDPSREYTDHQIALWELVRASTAAPVYFRPEDIELRDDLTFKFVDGGVTPYNNPSFLLYRMATAPEYRLGWASGEHEMMLVSVGTGSAALVDLDLPDKGRTIIENAMKIPGILMAGAAIDQDINCRAVGRCVAGPFIDRELGDMIPRRGDPLTGPVVPLHEDLGRAFLYARLDPDVSAEGLAALGLDHIPPDKVQAMDDVKSLPEMREVGRTYAAKHVDMAPFKRFIS